MKLEELIAHVERIGGDISAAAKFHAIDRLVRDVARAGDPSVLDRWLPIREEMLARWRLAAWRPPAKH